MGTSSARLSHLDGFVTDAGPIGDGIDDVRTTGRTRIDDFVDGAGEISVSIDATERLAYIVDYRAEVEHLAAWVAQVAAGFRSIGSSLPGGTVSADDGALSSLVGEPTILEQEQAAQGQDDARELIAALEEAGIDPSNFSTDQLIFFHEAENYDELYALLQEHADNMWSEDYAQGYFDVINADGIHAVLAVMDSYAHDGDGVVGDVGADILIPFANGFATTTGSPDLEQERTELLDIEYGWEVRHLSMLLAGNGSSYDPDFLATAADVVLMGDEWYPANVDDFNGDSYGAPPNLYGEPDPAWYPGLNGGPLYDDLYLNYPELMVLQALGDNVEASHTFTMMSDEHLAALVRPEQSGLFFVSGGDRNAEEVLALAEGWAGDVLVNTFLEAPYGVRDPDNPGEYVQIVTDWDAQLDAYDAFLAEVGEGGVPDIIKRDAASTILPYLPEIADVAAAESLTSAIEEDGRFSRPTLVAFFEELAYDEEAIEIVGANVGVWGDAMLLDIPPDELMDDALTDALRRITLVTGVAVDGLQANEDTQASDHALFWGGVTRGTSFVLGGGAALVPVIAGGPVAWGVSAGIAGTSALVNFGLGTYAAGQDAPVPEVDADDFENLMAVQWREMLATYHFEEGNLTTVDGKPLPAGASLEAQVNALTRLMAGAGGDDKFEEMLQTIDDDRDPDDHW